MVKQIPITDAELFDIVNRCRDIANDRKHVPIRETVGALAAVCGILADLELHRRSDQAVSDLTKDGTEFNYVSGG